MKLSSRAPFLSSRAPFLSSRAPFLSSRAPCLSSRAQRGICTLLLLLAAPLAAQTVDSIEVRRANAERLWNSGNRPAARREYEALAQLLIDRNDQLTSRQVAIIAEAIEALGIEEPQLRRDALIAYDRAIAKDPDNLDARVGLARLFLDSYNSGEAKKTLADLFARNRAYVPALLLEAERRDFDHEPGADSVLAIALAAEPENVKGRVLRARFLADAEDFAGARREIDRALRANAGSAEALAAGLALSVAVGDTGSNMTYGRRFAQLYPASADAHVAVAEQLARVRQYEPAARWAREGTRIDSTNWAAYSALGLNLLRIGDIEAGKAALERSFTGDPYNVWVKNTLDLLDTFSQYDVVTQGQFRFMIEKAESGVIGVYLKDLAERAFATFSARYGFTPSRPIRVEVYRSHADFSVRTVGLAGIGALGVSFGNTVAFDSPAAKDAGPFNWASTAWHELAHTFTLGATNNRVPRWLSEGLSVFEERRGRKGWGQNVSPGFLQAYAEGKIEPPSRLNDGFIRPSFPQEVIYSYYAASLVCELIARDFGERALMDMLRAYRDGANTEQVFRRVLKTDLAAFDKRFDTFVRERFGSAMEAIRDRSWAQQVQLGRAMMRRGDTLSAVEPLERARSLFPEYGGADGPYPLLARALIVSGNRKRAADVLSTMVSLGDVAFETHVSLADLLLQTGDTAGAAAALESAMFMNPYEIAQHERLASLYSKLGNAKGAVRERAAVVALNPVDKAEAWYQLALAHRAAGSNQDARRSVIRALEDAPHFERAQELLLQLHEGRQP
jgi:cellulose synthase operon protein C